MVAPVETVEETAGYAEYVRWCGRTGAARPPLTRLAGSRKSFLKKISPHKGTGRYLQYTRCPCCGKLARPQAIGNAGTHRLSISQCTGPKGGYRTGFNWEPIPEILRALKESLERALAQVNDALDVVGPPTSGSLQYPLWWAF